MLLPFMLGLCATAPASGDGSADSGVVQASHAAMMAELARANLATAVAVAAVHTVAMMLAGIGMAWAVYRYLGLRVLRSAWLNLDTAWGASLVAAGAALALLV